jgi:GLPGLI family protein
MKNWIITIGLIISIHQMHAQYFNFFSNHEDLSKYSVVDSAYLKCSYRLTYLKQALNPKETSSDLQILLAGQTVSKYYSQYALDYHHFVMEEVKKGADAVSNITERGAWSYQVFKNYPSGKVTVADIASMLEDNFNPLAELKKR